jgi:rhamnose transport system permease protein
MMAKMGSINGLREKSYDIAKLREIGIIFPLFLFGLIIALRNPYFISWENLRYIFLDASILTIVAIGEMMVILTGGIDLSVGSNLALTGMTVSMIYRDFHNFPVILAPLIGILIGGVCGAINGLFVAKGKVIPIIATISTMYIFRGIVYIISGGRWVNAHEMPEGYKLLTRVEILGIPILVIYALIVFLFFYYLLNYKAIGRSIYAVGNNPQSAIYIGINKVKVLFLVYLISGILAGLSGVLYTSRFASAESSAAIGFELSAISAVVIGGVKTTGGSGKIGGVVLGALLLTMIVNGLNVMKISPFYKLALQGLMFLIAVIVDSLIAERYYKGRRRRV